MKKLKDYLPGFDITNYDVENVHDVNYIVTDSLRRRKNNMYQKKSRIKKAIQKVRASGNLNKYFLTLTYTDSILKQNKKVLRKMLINYLEQNTDYYVVNDDYGSKNNRYHHHAIVTTWLSKEKIIERWHGGFGYADRIGFDVQNYKNVEKYIKKLENHALKETSSSIKIGDNSEKNIVSLAMTWFDEVVVVDE